MNNFSTDQKASVSTDSRRSLQAEAKSLLRLLNELDPGEPLWCHDDLQNILEHQLEAPLLVDLGSMQGVDEDRVRLLATSQGLVLRSFEDLLSHAHPPVELLILTKEFAKRNLVSPRSPIPGEVARILYFSCIAAALVHCHRKISQLSQDEINKGMAWCLQRQWLKSERRKLFEEAGLVLNQGAEQ